MQASAPETAEPAGPLDEVAARAGFARVALEADTAAAAAARCDYGPVQAVAVPFAAAVAVDWAAPEAGLWAGSVEPVEAYSDAAAVPEPAGFDAAVPTAARTAVTAAGSADAAPVQAPRVAVVAPAELVAAYSDSGPRLAVPADAVSQREVQLRGAEPAHCSMSA